MKTSALRAFLLTVDTGSMAEASRRLNITAAAVAQQIHSLENEIGVELVMRAGKTVRPTEAGHRILARSRALLLDTANLKTLANLGETSGELRLGAINTAAESLVPDIVSELFKTYPNIHFHIKSALSLQLFSEVQHDELDVAICLHPEFGLPKTLAWQTLREERMVLFVPKELSAHEPHELLKTQPFIRFDRKQWGGQQVEHYLRKANIVPRERLEISHLTVIVALVSRGVGVALAPDTALPSSVSNKIARLTLPLATKPRQLGILWQRASSHGKLIDLFVRQAMVLCQASG